MFHTSRITRILSTTRLATVAGACAMTLAACSSATSPVEPRATDISASPLSLRYAQPAQYSMWWQMAKECSGLSRDVSGVQFYAVEASELNTSDDTTATTAGEWFSSSNSIAILKSETNNAAVVRHEMLHALIVAGGHPADKFRDSCSGFVNCEAACAQQVGAQPVAPATAEHVELSDIALTQRVYPAQINMSADPEGWFALVIEVHNPHAYPVWVNLKPFPGRSDIAATFGYAAGTTTHQSYVNGESLSLMAGETKRVVYDLKAKDYMAETGSREIHAFFNSQQLPVVTLNVAE